MSEWAQALVPILLDSSLRTLTVGVAAGVVLFVLRIRSGSVRHATWVCVLATMLLMPFLVQYIPPVGIHTPIPSSPVDTLVSYVADSASTQGQRQSIEVPTPTTASADPAVMTAARPLPSPVWPIAVLTVYVLGVCLLSIRLLLGWRLMWSMVREARELSPGLFESQFVSTPVTIGVLRPHILLPKTWKSWPEENLRAVLAHERAHVRRRDPLTGFLARVNCAVFWFHPFSWWLQKRLAATAEHACDDFAVEAIGRPKVYAEILLDMAQAVRRRGRFSWQAIGVHGDGLLGQRIDRVLRNDRVRISIVRKLAIAVNCASVIFVVVACRDQSSLLSLKGNIQLEEQRAIARYEAERARRSAEQKDFATRWNRAWSGERLTPEQAGHLEAELKNDSENIETRERLFYFYARGLREQKVSDEKIIPARRSLVLWFIEHHPDSEILATSAARINPSPFARLADPDGYAAARQQWLSLTDRPGATIDVLRNAAFFFEVADKPLAETLLMRAKTTDPGEEWSIRLGRLYALALLGVNDGVTIGGPASNFGGIQILSIGLKEANDPFAQHVREIMARTKDAQLLNAAAQYLTLHPLGSQLGITYLERAVQLEPTLVPAHGRLLRMRLADRFPETHAALRKIDKEKKYAAISALPASERFVISKEMAEYSYTEAGSLEILDGDAAKAARARSRRYADDLLKLAPHFRKDPAYSAAVFSADMLAGTIAARDGDIQTAVKYLRDASNIPVSEELAYLPPYVPYDLLCKILIGSGYRDDVIAFLEHFAEITVSNRDYFLRMAANARSGRPLLVF